MTNNSKVGTPILQAGTPVITVEPVQTASGRTIPLGATGRLKATFEDEDGTGAVIVFDSSTLPRGMAPEQRVGGARWAVRKHHVDRRAAIAA